MIDENKLRELAQNAGQDKWEFWHGDVAHSVDNEGAVMVAHRPKYSGGKWQSLHDANMRYIAEANPQTILSLLDELDHLRDQARQHEAFQQFVNASEQQRLNDARREGWQAAQELALVHCLGYMAKQWTLFKHGDGIERGDSYTQGQSDGAEHCSHAIEGIQPPAEWASSEQCGAAPHAPDHDRPA